MKFFFDKHKSEELTKRIEAKFFREYIPRGNELHVSDLTACLMKPVCRLIGLKREDTKASVGLMVFGIIAENVVAWTYPADVLQFKSSMNLLKDEDDIFGHIDIFEEKRFPLEVKGTRKRIFKTKDMPLNWVEQLVSYVSMQGADKGWLVILNILSCQLMAFRVEMTDQDRLDWLITLTSRADAVKKLAKEIIEKGININLTVLEIRSEDYSMCSWKKSCPRLDECKRKAKELKKRTLD